MRIFFTALIVFCLVFAVWDFILLVKGDLLGLLGFFMLFLAWLNYRNLRKFNESDKEHEEFMRNLNERYPF